jgi:hypothetical protein
MGPSLSVAGDDASAEIFDHDQKFLLRAFSFQHVTSRDVVQHTQNHTSMDGQTCLTVLLLTPSPEDCPRSPGSAHFTSSYQFFLEESYQKQKAR